MARLLGEGRFAPGVARIWREKHLNPTEKHRIVSYLPDIALPRFSATLRFLKTRRNGLVPVLLVVVMASAGFYPQPREHDRVAAAEPLKMIVPQNAANGKCTQDTRKTIVGMSGCAVIPKAKMPPPLIRFLGVGVQQ